MKKYSVGFLLLLLITLTPWAEAQQRDAVELKGVVLDADSLDPLPFVHIRVKNSSLANATQENGTFNINVHATDSIVFTSIGYKPLSFVPADSTEEALQHLTIRLTPQVYELSEVSVKAYEDITKYIRRETKPPSMRLPERKPLFELDDPKEAKAVSLGTGMNGASLEGAVTAFANLFNDKFQQEKKLKKLLEIEEAEKKQQYLEEIMTEKYHEIVRQTSRLQEADIKIFTQAYMPPPNEMVNMNDYQLIAGILHYLKEYQPRYKERIPVDELLEKGTFEGDDKTVENRPE